jgi:hypothetical protein
MNADDAARISVEAAVRAQLSKALGGVRGTLEGAVPTVGFTVSWMITKELKLSVAIGVIAAVILLAVRLAQKSTPQFVLNSLFGIGIGAFFALKSGKAENVFLPGILYNAGYTVAMLISILARWPVVGFMIGSVTGDATAWHKDPAVVRLCSKLTWLLLLPCAVRVAVQYPLYLAGEVDLLAASKLALGWPLQIASFGAMIWVLTRGRTVPTPEVPKA